MDNNNDTVCVAAHRQVADGIAGGSWSLCGGADADFQGLDIRLCRRHTDESERHAACWRLDSGPVDDSQRHSHGRVPVGG